MKLGGSRRGARAWKPWKTGDRKTITVALVATILFVVSLTLYYYTQPAPDYSLSAEAQTLIPQVQPQYAEALKKSSRNGAFEYNQDYTAPSEVTGQIGTPRFSATFHANPRSGITLTDPLTDIKLTIKPKFISAPAKKDQNRLIYPLSGDSQVVYSLQTTKVKEDIILNKYRGDTLQFDYKLSIPDGAEARMEPNGAVGIYSVDPSLLGSVSTGSSKDAKLLASARKNGEKSTLLFTIPAPFVKEYGKTASSARAWLSLDGNNLRLHASGLRDATYPLTIDPSVYIDTAARLMGGNNDSNIDFDIDNELIQKGKTTGGRFDAWTSTLALPSARWNSSTAVAGGYIYTVGGNDGTTTQSGLYWAKFNSSTGVIEATNPGNGACSDWCTSSNYNLPSSRQGASVVAYNGYLYVMGGLNSGGSTTSTVYIAKIGANGEPQLWHPTDSVQSNWTYWYSDTALSSARTYMGAVAYSGQIYLVGGSTTGPTGGTTTVERAEIGPLGTLGAWTTSGMSQLSTAVLSHGLQVYNDRLYVIGGVSTTTTQSAVLFSKINSDGTINAWQTGNPIGNTGSTTARAALGGSFTTIWGGYIYVSGGCSAVNASGYCTSISNDTKLASINADGSITDWTTIAGVTSTKMGYGLVSWRNRLYAIGGCSAQNTSTGVCTTTLTTTQYGAINQDGDVSTVSSSVPSGTSPCVTTAWVDCDLPPEGDGNGEGGRMAGAAIINNGYIYYFGGCTAVNSGSVCYTGNAGKSTDNVSYASIAADGKITRVGSCAGSFVGSWCVINGGLGASISAFGYSVFNNTMYMIGGTTGVDWQANVLRSTFNSDGTWGAWTTQTFASIGLGNARGYMYAFSRANPASASTYPGNLYVLGGCSGVTSTDNGLDCTGNTYTEVYKCNIKTDGSIENTTNTCTTTGQLQIDSEPGTGGSQGLGVMAGTVYANYVYLIGGQSPNESERGQVMYAKIDNSNNIVAVSGSIWTTSAYSISPVRRRGVAFGYNGYLYALAGYNTTGGGSLNDLLYAKINVSDGSIGTFNTSSVTVSARWDLRAAVNNGYVYAIAGCSTGAPPASCSVMTGTVQTFQLYNNYSGSPKLYSAGTQFTTDRYGASSAVLNGYIYVAGGCTTTTDCTTASTSVQYASIGADGVIGSWSATTGSLTAARVYGQLEAAGGTLYYIGGQTSGSTAGTTTVYYATPSSGNIASWATATNGIPSARTQHGATVWNNRIYVVGGIDSGGTTVTNTVYVSPQLSSGGNITSAWSSASTSFNVARSGATAIAYANNLYVLGGYDGTNYLNDVQYSQINTSTGDAGAWSYTTSLPSVLRQADGFAANGFMYLFGGRSASTTCNSNTISAPISANTTIATGNNPTGVGEWYATNIRYSGSRYGAAASYYDGKAYVMGGMCNGTIVTTTNKTQYSTLQSQPQIAKYSRLIDTDTNIAPTKWLLNGIDNSIGARWRATYKSAMDAANLGNTASFDNGVNGNPVTEASTSYTDCYANSPVTNNYSNATFVTAGLSMRQQIASGTNGNAGCYQDLPTTTAFYQRFYVQFNPYANLSANTTFVNITNDALGETIASIRITTTGTIQLRDEFTNEFTSTALAADTWHRLEFAVFGDRLYMRTYEGANLHGMFPTQVGNISLDNTVDGLGAPVDTIDRTNVGIVSSINYINSTIWGLNIDEHKVSRSGWVGSAYPAWGQSTSYSDVTLGTPQTYTPLAPTYSTGTITQSGTTVTAGGGAKWTGEQVGATLTYQDGSTATITAVTTTGVNDGIRLTSSVSKTIDSAQTYTISNDNSEFSRWHWFTLTIDASQTFGYPEDVTRGPTIADLSLFFTADPSRRLIHGKTFTGGEQQPLDTPF